MSDEKNRMTSEVIKRTLDDTNLNAIERQALADLRARLFAELDFVDEIILFGSAARGTADAESDIDLLVLTKYALDNWTRHTITDIIADVNDEYETNFSSLVVDQENWRTGLISVLPIKIEISRDGVPV